jgi:hypothetical protein
LTDLVLVAELIHGDARLQLFRLRNGLARELASGQGDQRLDVQCNPQHVSHHERARGEERHAIEDDSESRPGKNKKQQWL